MKKLVVVGMILVYIGCAVHRGLVRVPDTPVIPDTDPLVPVTANLIKLLQENGYAFTQLQFFISSSLDLEKSSDAPKTVRVAGDTIRTDAGAGTRRFRLDAKTPGTGSLYNPDVYGSAAIKIRVDNNPKHTLYFAKDSKDTEALFYLRCPEVAGSRIVEWEGIMYDAKFEGAKLPFLLVKLDSRFNSMNTTNTLPGEWLPHLLVGTYETTLSGKDVFGNIVTKTVSMVLKASDPRKPRLFVGDTRSVVIYEVTKKTDEGKVLGSGTFTIVQSITSGAASTNEANSITVEFSDDITVKYPHSTKNLVFFTGRTYNFKFRKGAPTMFSDSGLTWALKPPAL